MPLLNPQRQVLRNPPPDPQPRVPAQCLPPLAWDCHIHLFGPARDFPFEAASPYVSDDALPEEYLRVQRMLGLQRAVVVSGGGYYGADYRHLQSVLERFGTHFRGIILARSDLTEQEVIRLNALGVRGGAHVRRPL